MENKISGSVINIIDEFRIIINLGKNVVKKWDTIYIYDKDNSIKDLDGTILGTYDICKAKLKVSEVYDKFSICSDFSTPIDEQRQALNNINISLSPLLKSSNKNKKLNIDPQAINSIDKAIRIGDIVKLF